MRENALFPELDTNITIPTSDSNLSSEEILLLTMCIARCVRIVGMINDAVEHGSELTEPLVAVIRELQHLKMNIDTMQRSLDITQ